MYIDGERAETFKVLQAMLGVKVGGGEHNIKIEYTPEGFRLGVTISFLSAVLLILITVSERKRRLRRRELMSANRLEAGEADGTSTYRQGAAIYDQFGIPRPEDHIGRVEDSEVVLYDSRDMAEKEKDNAKSESNDSLQGH